MSVCIVVLGDVGRSPRMQYHSLSFLNEGFGVNIIGIKGSKPVSDLVNHPNVTFYYMNDPPEFKKYIPRILAYFLKVIWQAVTLFFTLFWKERSQFLMVQNPPSIPTLAVCWLYCRLTETKFIIDWHNCGYSILALTLGTKHMLVRISYWFEKYFGRKADLSFCVTNGMKNYLIKEWQISSIVLHDRPPAQFCKISKEESHKLFCKLSKEFREFSDEADETKTKFTKITDDGSVTWREDRPGLLISSTSWTEDEDFSVLLKALERYEVCCSGAKGSDLPLPPLLCVITGKGPMKSYYQKVISEKEWRNVKFVMPWLEAEDYPKLLASGDLGVSLHKSSSGLDLPMKVVDMFGCGLPVCAFNFQCIDELVINEKNGLIFDTHEELANEIEFFFKGFPKSQLKLKKYREEVDKFSSLRWHDNWTNIVLPEFVSLKGGACL